MASTRRREAMSIISEMIERQDETSIQLVTLEWPEAA